MTRSLEVWLDFFGGGLDGEKQLEDDIIYSNGLGERIEQQKRDEQTRKELQKSIVFLLQDG